MIAPPLQTVGGVPRGSKSSLGRSRPSVAARAVPQLPSSDAPVVLWFKNDLRVHDNHGLIAVAEAAARDARAVVPVFIVDHALGAAGASSPREVAGAVAGLQKALRALGSDLVILVGPVDAQLAAVCRDTEASAVVAEDDVDHAWRSAASRAATAAGVPLIKWRSELRTPGAYDQDWRELSKRAGRMLAPLPAPASLPPLPAGLAVAGSAVPPTAAELEAAWTSADFGRQRWERGFAGQAHLPYVVEDEADPRCAADRKVAALTDTGADEGEAGVRAALDAWTRGDLDLSYLDDVHAPGQAFASAFSPALAVGTLSPREIAAAARRGGPSWDAVGAPGGQLPPARWALTTAEAADFHAQLALDDAMASAGSVARPPGQPDGGWARSWRWRGGGLLRYSVAHPPGCSEASPSTRPAVVLVHGFGASDTHWRDGERETRGKGGIGPRCCAGRRRLSPIPNPRRRSNLAGIAAQADADVYALCLPGFGRSEKLPLRYTQHLWSASIDCFVRSVVGRRVVVGGNSIGGFCAVNWAAQSPELVEGIVLLNSAGKVDPTRERHPGGRGPRGGATGPPRWMLMGGAGLLFAALQPNIKPILSYVYPAAPDRADAWLADEIERASADPGALQVLASGSALPQPETIDSLLRDVGAPVLVCQGLLDPLNDSPARVVALQEALGALVRVAKIEGGHCPHDEKPDEVNAAVAAFVRDVVKTREPALA